MSVRTVLDEHESLRMREACLLQHMDVVYKIARHYSQMFPSHYDDLVQVGAIGLLNAINRYDPAKKTNFKTYASHLIASEMKHYLRDLTAVVKPPRELQELLPRVRQAESVLGMRLGREPLACELIAYLGISFEKLDEIRRLEKNNYPVSLDQEIHSESGNHTLLLDQLEDPQYKSFQLAQEDRLLIQEAMSKVKFQSRQILEFAFYQNLTQTEIARNLNISQMQVSRRLKKALGELWDTLNTRVTPW